MRTVYWREQRHICGESYDRAAYMEVDLYPVTPAEHRASSRAKRRAATCLAMQRYNERRARRYHVQLVNTNFREGDLSWTGTYDDEHLPGPEDRERADRDWSNFIKRLYRWCRKHSVARPRWIEVTEYTTVQPDGTTLGRHHHHAILERVVGLTREVLEGLWTAGMTRCEPLRVEHGSVESLVNYLSKNRRCSRSWRQSRGLKKPIVPKPNDTRWSRKRLEEASTTHVDDGEYWSRMYPGWTLERVEATVFEGGQRHTLVILHRREPGGGERRSLWKNPSIQQRRAS